MLSIQLSTVHKSRINKEETNRIVVKTLNARENIRTIGIWVCGSDFRVYSRIFGAVTARYWKIKRNDANSNESRQ